jgi:hypothetical protein
MPLSGRCLMPREIAELGATYWGGVGLTKWVSTCLGESNGYVGAFHDNRSSSGTVTSRDCGLAQISIPARLVGTADEDNLRTDSLDPLTWKPVAQGNAAEAHELYNQPWVRNGKRGIREWQPWVAYTTGWATFPEWWVWSPSHEEWLPTGRYVQRAIPGVANYHLVTAKDRDRGQALHFAKQHQHTFKIAGQLGIVEGIVAWTSVPHKPTVPPPGGFGKRPVPNDGH